LSIKVTIFLIQAATPAFYLAKANLFIISLLNTKPSYITDVYKYGNFVD